MCTEIKFGADVGETGLNLRPVVPQTSRYFQKRAEFDLEWFCGELVGMTTRARVMESAGIAEKHLIAPPGFQRDFGLVSPSNGDWGWLLERVASNSAGGIKFQSLHADVDG